MAGWRAGPGIPADPETPPRLTIRTAAGATVLALTADDTTVPAQPARWPVRAASPCPPRASPRAGGMLHVAGPDGRDLTGSPLDPSPAVLPADSAARRAPPRPGRTPDRAVAVVVPVHGGMRLTLDCLDLGARHHPAGTAVMVVDDASPEPDLVRALDALAARRRIVLLRHARNRGFPASANAGLRAACALAGDVTRCC